MTLQQELHCDAEWLESMESMHVTPTENLHDFYSKRVHSGFHDCECFVLAVALHTFSWDTLLISPCMAHVPAALIFQQGQDTLDEDMPALMELEDLEDLEEDNGLAPLAHTYPMFHATLLKSLLSLGWGIHVLPTPSDYALIVGMVDSVQQDDWDDVPDLEPSYDETEDSHPAHAGG